MNRAVIFDLDGTLLDTLPDLQYNCNLMLEHFGFPTVDREKVRLSIGNGAIKLVERVLGDNYDHLRFDEYFKFYSNLYDNSQSPKTNYFEGIPTVLKELKKRGYKLAICTNKPQIPTDNACEKYFKEFGFEMAVGLTDKIEKKPDPQATLNILEKLGVEKENAYFVGDGETDVETAKNAGIKNIAVLWGYRKKEDLEQAGAKIFAEKPLDLLDLISL